MGNKPTPGPALGEAANEYRLPLEQARQKALKHKELAATLKENGRKGIGPRNTLENLKTGTHIPAAYDAKSKETTHTIKRDPTPYAPVFAKAEQYALELQLQHDDCSPEDLFCIHLIAIQRAINEGVRPDQKLAEGNLDHLIDETSTKGEVTMSTEDIKAREAEVCTMKSMIAKHYLQQHCPGVSTTMLSESAYKGGNEGHNYLQIEQGKTVHEYHANSPHPNGLPHLTGLSDKQRKTLDELHQGQQQKGQGQQAIRRTLGPQQLRLAA